MASTSSSWLPWALGSAGFAALTAIFAKIGLAGVDADLATLIRTAVIGVVLSGFVFAAGKWSNPLALSGKTWTYPLWHQWPMLILALTCLIGEWGLRRWKGWP